MEYTNEQLIKDFAKDIREKYIQYNNDKTSNIKYNVIRKISLTMASACEDEIALLVSKILNKKYNILIDVYLSYYDEKGNKKSYRPDILIVKTTKDGHNIKNEIVGIVEVKAQMGYCGVLKPEDFEPKLNNLGGYIYFDKDDYDVLKSNNEAIEFYERLGLEEKKRTIEFTVSNKTQIYVVDVLSHTHYNKVVDTINNFENSKNPRVHFYSLFRRAIKEKKEKYIWYNNIDETNIFENDMSGDEEITIRDRKNNKTRTVIITNKNRIDHGFNKFIEDIRKIKVY